MVVNPNLQNKFIKKVVIHSSAKAGNEMKLIQIVRKVFQCSVVDFLFIVKVGKCWSKDLWRHPGSGGL